MASMNFNEDQYSSYLYGDISHEETRSEPVCWPIPSMFPLEEAPVDPTVNPSPGMSLDLTERTYEEPNVPNPILGNTTREGSNTPVLAGGQNEPFHPPPKGPSTPGRGIRHPSDQVEILWRFYRNWGDSPNAQSKKDLVTESGLTNRQVTDWFSNKRRKSKKANNARSLRAPSLSLTEGSPASDTSPYFHGSSDYSGAELADLYPSRTLHRKKPKASHPTGEHGHWIFGLSAPPFESGEVLTSSQSNSPMLSLPLDRPGRPIQRRSGRPSNIVGRFPCTFCSRSSKTAHEWSKHENTHLSTEIWTCRLCPSQDRKQSGRKDHFVQHLRQVHRTGYDATFMSGWCSKTDNIRSRCGICSASLETWTDRKSHIAGHWREGHTMAEWKGGWGLDHKHHIRLENATPPEEWPNRSSWTQLAL